ncbi:MAG: peroxiredoxin family protein [Thermomicrobiales bacterium]
MPLIVAGTDAPDFEVKTSTGKTFRLRDALGATRTMLVFYPKDFTPGCTDQLIEVRNSVELIRSADTEPMGVNPDDAESHEKFRTTYELPFELLVDEDRTIATAYGSLKDDGVGIQRSVIVIGKDGKVIFSSEGAPSWSVVHEAINAAGDAG